MLLSFVTFQVEPINFDAMSKSSAVISGFGILQGSIATQLRWGGRPCNNYMSFFGNLLVKEFWKSVNICRSYDEKSSALLLFLTHRVLSAACCRVLYTATISIHRPINYGMRTLESFCIANFIPTAISVAEQPLRYRPVVEYNGFCTGTMSECRCEVTPWRIGRLWALTARTILLFSCFTQRLRWHFGWWVWRKWPDVCAVVAVTCQNTQPGSWLYTLQYKRKRWKQGRWLYAVWKIIENRAKVGNPHLT